MEALFKIAQGAIGQRIARAFMEEPFDGGGFFGVHGSGRVVREERQVSDFDQVALRGIGHLRITQGDHEALTIEAEDNIIPELITEVHGRRLEIGPREGSMRSMRPTKPITFYLTVKELSDVKLSGSGSIEADSLNAPSLSIVVSGSGDARIGTFQGNELKTTISGSGSLRIAGEATEQSVHISGSGNYRAEELSSNSCDLRISGAGRADVRVEQTLDVVISGAGDIRYRGNPTVRQTISGAGRVRQQSD